MAPRSFLPRRAEGGDLYQVSDARTPFEDITTYNNYYELGTDKSDPAENAGSLRTSPWTIAIDGEVERPQRIDHRHARSNGSRWKNASIACAASRGGRWSSPALGFPLADLVKRLKPTSRAKYVEFRRCSIQSRCPGKRADVLEWPYVEGAAHRRSDEPAHAHRRRPLRQGVARPKRGAPAPGRALEIRLQGHQIDREDSLRRRSDR